MFHAGSAYNPDTASAWWAFALNIPIGAAAVTGLGLTLRSLSRDRRDRLEQRAARQATSIRVEAVSHERNPPQSHRKEVLFYPEVRNASDGEVFDIEVQVVTLRAKSWEPKSSMAALFPWKFRSAAAGATLAGGPVMGRRAPLPDLQLTFTDRFRDRWCLNPDGVLILLEPATVVRQHAR